MWLSAARLSETGVAFAGRRGGPVETGVTFAGEKWAFLLCFLVAEVSSVSTGAVQGRAVVAVVAPSRRHRVQCTKKLALRGLVVGVSAKKSALRGLLSA